MALGQRPYLVGHHGEAAARLAGAGASIAALSASRLVCSATALITSMTLPILSLSFSSTFSASVERLTSLARRSIWAIASATTLSPWRASSSASMAACAACSALRATSCTVADISCMAVATWSVSTFWLLTPALVCSVTAESCSAALLIWLTPSRMPPISSRRVAAMRWMPCCSTPISSRRLICALLVRSPEAMRSTWVRVSRSGRMICRVISQAASTPNSTASRALTSCMLRASPLSIARRSTWNL